MNPKKPEFVQICPPQLKIPGSLSGLRLGVKDLFDIAGRPTAAGHPTWLATHPVPSVTAPVVTALLEAGAELVGKTLTDELAYSLEGINQHYGTPLNPKAPQRLPGGSSSGSAVAVANDSVDIGLGTDTGGSIRVPAGYNGLYGLRPSHGLISCDRLVPLAPQFDTVGWLTRDLVTMQKVAQVLLPQSKNKPLSHLIVANIEGVYPWQMARQQLLAAITPQFATINYVNITTEKLAQASAAFRTLQGREIWRIHGSWIATHQPDFAQAIGDRFRWCQSLTEEDELEAQQQAHNFITYWQTQILPSDDYVLLMPTTPGAAPLLATPGTELQTYRSTLMGLTAPAGLTSAPQISLPYLADEKAEQAPWGVSLLARPNCDRALLDCAAKIDLAGI